MNPGCMYLKLANTMNDESLLLNLNVENLSGLNIEVSNAYVIDNNNGDTMMWRSLYNITGTFIDKSLNKIF